MAVRFVGVLDVSEAGKSVYVGFNEHIIKMYDVRVSNRLRTPDQDVVFHFDGRIA